MRALNKKGFTLIEVVLSFVLITIILGELMMIVMNYQGRANEEQLRSDYMTLKSLVTKDVQTDILKLKLQSAERCNGTNDCVELTFANGEKKQLLVHNVQTAQEVTNKYIQYGDRKYKIREDFPDDKDNNWKLTHQSVDVNAGRLLEKIEVDGRVIYSFRISLTSSYFVDDFGFHIVTVV